MDGLDEEETIVSSDCQWPQNLYELLNVPKLEYGKTQRTVPPLPEISEKPKGMRKPTKSSKNCLSQAAVLPEIKPKNSRKRVMFRRRILTSRSSEVSYPVDDEIAMAGDVKYDAVPVSYNTNVKEAENYADGLFEEPKEDERNKKQMITVVIEQPEMESETSSMVSLSPNHKIQKDKMSERKKSGVERENIQTRKDKVRCSSAPPAIHPLKYLPNLFITAIKKKKNLKKTKKQSKKPTANPLPRTQPVKIKHSALFQQKPQKGGKNKTKKEPVRETILEGTRPIQEEITPGEDDFILDNDESPEENDGLTPRTFTEEEIRQLSEKYFSKLRSHQESLKEENRTPSAKSTASRKMSAVRSSEENNDFEEPEEEPWSEKIWRLVILALQEPLPFPIEKARTRRAGSLPAMSTVVQPIRIRRAKSLPAIDIKPLLVPAKPERLKKQKKLGKKGSPIIPLSDNAGMNIIRYGVSELFNLFNFNLRLPFF